ncbi:putative membrane protein [Lipingzhangella halophila]|uniref:Putative membrane protein n=1 Tax=Lipingzhangella halophila TaxID=1783352 RepID=A0A7W7W660_9ACTN|nr:glycosyltransferase 87 family protein [Lipingzhangella halophila]MBB4935401.1 putative membrane protein [Lipingzhangella halophila]
MTGHPDQPRAGAGSGAGTRRVTVSVPWGGLAAIAAAGAVLGYLLMVPCRFGDDGQYVYGCYTDILPLYYRDGLDTGTVPYLDKAVEYPVLTGGLMLLAARAVAWLPDTTARAFAYFDLTAGVLAAALVVVVLGTGYLAGRGGLRADAGTFDRTRALLAGGFVALSPAAVLAAFINWDLLAVALFTGGLVCCARGRQWLGGALVGLAVSAKFYPFLVFGPLLVLVLRRLLGREGGIAPGDLLRSLAGAVAAWTAVNLPVYLAAPEGWAEFFAFSRERGADWGSVYYLLSGLGLFDLADRDLVNLLAPLAFGAACAGIAALGLLARRPPAPEQLVFLVVAAFLLTNKVWSPQFVLWLLPLAVLAWPRTMRPGLPVAVLGLWQVAEVVYHFGIWQHLRYVEALASGAAPVGLGIESYALVALGRLVTLLAVCGIVVVDSLRDGQSAG